MNKEQEKDNAIRKVIKDLNVSTLDCVKSLGVLIWMSDKEIEKIAGEFFEIVQFVNQINIINIGKGSSKCAD